MEYDAVYHGPMSVILGDSLPAELVERLLEPAPVRLQTLAILITTVDERGRAHPALLSYGEVGALDSRHLRLATYADSRTSENLRRRGTLTLCFVEEGAAYYVKTHVRELPGPPRGHPHLAAFEAEVEEVLFDGTRPDHESDAYLTGGITFRAADPERRLRDSASLRAALAEPVWTGR